MDTTINQQPGTATANMEAYFKTHDSRYVAEDAVFHNMSTGEAVTGRQAIEGMLHFMYQEAFNAKAEVRNTIVTPTNAVLEARFVGKHTGAFAGMKASGKAVDVPLCVTYDLDENGLIKTARVYMQMDVMMQQLNQPWGTIAPDHKSQCDGNLVRTLSWQYAYDKLADIVCS